MKKNRQNEIKVGLVTISSILLFIIGISLGKSCSVSVSDQTIKMRFPNSGGLKSSDPVVVNGVRRGTVTAVRNEGGAVLVEATLDDTRDLRGNPTAKITILEITGGKKVEIFPGDKGDFDINKEIKGETPADLAELVALVGEVSGDATRLVRRLDTIADAGTNLLADGKVVADLRNAADGASRMVASLNRLVESNYSTINSSLADVKAITTELRLAIRDNKPGIERLIKQLDVTVNRANNLMIGADTAVVQVNMLLKDLNRITGDVRGGSGLVTKLLYDAKFAASLDSTLTRLSLFLNKVDENDINVNVRLGTRP